MASLTDLYGDSPAASSFITLGNNDSDVREDAGLEGQRLLHRYETRLLPQMMDRYAARGTFMSGHARVAADQLREDVGQGYGDIQRLMARQLSKLAQDRLLQTLGGIL